VSEVMDVVHVNGCLNLNAFSATNLQSQHYPPRK